MAAQLLAAQGEIGAGTELSLRLLTEVSSKHSKAGDTVRAELIAPVTVNGRAVIPAGLTVTGTVADPTPEHKRLNHSVLLLNFGKLAGRGNKSATFDGQVASVDNGRETVDAEGVIHGLRPLRRRPGEVEDLLLLAAVAHPEVLAALEAGRFIVAEEKKPRVTYAAGIELWVKLTSPLRMNDLPKMEGLSGPGTLLLTQELQRLIGGLPLRTATREHTPSDLTNILLIGSREEVINAFTNAGWVTAEANDLKTEAETFFAIAGRHSFHEAPVSTLLLNGNKPDLVFEKQANTFAKRHHVRIWESTDTYRGQPLWIGAGTHDIGITFSRKAKTFSHSVDSHIDEERWKIENDLSFTGQVAEARLVPRAGAPREFQNATGDHLQTDGAIAVLRLQGNDNLPKTR